jgi:hypothetical protein
MHIGFVTGHMLFGFCGIILRMDENSIPADFSGAESFLFA